MQTPKVSQIVPPGVSLGLYFQCVKNYHNPQLSSGVSLPNESLKDWRFNQEVARQELVKLIIMHELPFSLLVEYPKFILFCGCLKPMVQRSV